MSSEFPFRARRLKEGPIKRPQRGRSQGHAKLSCGKAPSGATRPHPYTLFDAVKRAGPRRKLFCRTKFATPWIAPVGPSRRRSGCEGKLGWVARTDVAVCLVCSNCSGRKKGAYASSMQPTCIHTARQRAGSLGRDGKETGPTSRMPLALYVYCRPATTEPRHS